MEACHIKTLFFVILVMVECLIVLALNDNREGYERLFHRRRCRCTCGTGRKMPRIVGGTASMIYEFPWMVGIAHKSKFYCGGAIINDLYVLTAAHCVHGINPKNIKVVISEFDMKDPAELPTMQRQIDKIKIHEEFDRRTFNHDIGLIRVKDRFRFSDALQPVCLPPRDMNLTGVIATVAGWGKILENGESSPILRKVEVPILSWEQCMKTMYKEDELTASMMCAGDLGNGNSDACQGDSGGPMVKKGKSGKYDMVGIVSWGKGCGRPEYPGIYTVVPKYLDWINNNTKHSCFCDKRQPRD